MKNKVKEKEKVIGGFSSPVSIFLAFRFMGVLALAMLSLAFIFVSALNYSVVKQHKNDLEKSVQLILQAITLQGTEELPFLELPYYVTYTVYEVETRNVIATNDNLLPLLNSYGKVRTYFVKNFFTDSDMNIRYLTKETDFSGKKTIIEKR